MPPSAVSATATSVHVTAKTGWWKQLAEEEADPITLEPLNSLPYPPFRLQLGEEDSRGALFDAKALADYLSAAKLFLNPLSRRALTREDCVRLDAHLRKHRLGRYTVARDFDEAVAAQEAAARVGTAEALAAQRRVAADAVLRSFFTSSALRRDSSGRGQPAPPPAMQQEGNFAVIDDDAGMARGRSRADVASLAVRLGAQQQLAGVGASSRTEHFPALPAPAAPVRPAWPVLGSGSGNDANIVRPSWWTLAAPPPPRRPAAPPQAPCALSSTLDAAREARRKQLASAFGVDNPDTRPSSFAASAAQAFTAETLALARQEPDFVRDIERRFDEALAAADANCAVGPKGRRVSLPAMPRAKRRLVHEVGATYHIMTQAYGEGPGRHIDLFLVPGLSSHPSCRLSDAARAPPEQLPAPVGGGGAALRLLFTDVAAEADLERMLQAWAGDYELSAAGTGGNAVATFCREAAFNDARDRLAGGVRGLFTVAVAACEGRPQPPPCRRSQKSAAAKMPHHPAADPWAEEQQCPSVADAPGPRFASGDDGAGWEELEPEVPGSSRVAPSRVAVQTRNAWGALDDDGDERGSDGAGAD